MSADLCIGKDALRPTELSNGYVPFAGKECPWCNEKYNWVRDNCGTGTTWSLWECQFCGKFLAEGWAIPNAAKGPNTKVVLTEPIALDKGIAITGDVNTVFGPYLDDGSYHALPKNR